MYGTVTNIYHTNHPNVGKYTVHGVSGICRSSISTTTHEDIVHRTHIIPLPISITSSHGFSIESIYFEVPWNGCLYYNHPIWSIFCESDKKGRLQIDSEIGGYTIDITLYIPLILTLYCSRSTLSFCGSSQVEVVSVSGDTLTLKLWSKLKQRLSGWYPLEDK